nr:hypothetical protein [Rhizobium sp. P32RR-XVIII]
MSFKEPHLPSFLDEVILRRLRIGDGMADVAIRHSGRQVVVDVLDRRGDVRMVTMA